MTPPSAVELFEIGLDAAGDGLDRARALLSDDERERADRFLVEQARRRFTVARAHLRTILAGAVGATPRELAFAYGPGGKPLLDGARVRFNLSHSHERALVALTLDREVGVDLERARLVPDALAIAERMFAPAERARLGSLPEAERASAFLRCWTRKEAFVKAVGEGLAAPLDAFEVSFARADEPARFLRVDGRDEDAQPFRLADVALGPGWHAALCTEGPCGPIVRSARARREPAEI